jgi:hypothetical protein
MLYYSAEFGEEMKVFLSQLMRCNPNTMTPWRCSSIRACIAHDKETQGKLFHPLGLFTLLQEKQKTANKLVTT